MARSTQDMEEELAKIWELVGDLSEQLENNRTLVTQLKTRSTDVKGQAAHVGAGFPLRRFNVDITEEEFTSEVEAFASHLVLENQQLQHDNKQLNGLLKEYETTLETVMGKFRGMAHASQQHDLSLHSYYTSLLQTLQTAHSSAHLHDNTSLSLLLNRLSTLLRSALRSMGGEDVELDLVAHLPGLLSAHASDASGSTSSGPPSPEKSRLSKIPRAPPRPVAFGGFQPGASGGYAGTEGQADWAIEREMEILRLEEENQSLRELLSISQEISVEEPVLPPTPKEEIEEVMRGSMSRKSSLTIAELEVDAAREAEEQERRRQLGEVFETSPRPSGNTGLALRKEGIAPASPIAAAAAAPVTSVEDTGIIQTETQGGSPVKSVLGFQAGLQAPEEVFEETAE